MDDSVRAARSLLENALSMMSPQSSSSRNVTDRQPPRPRAQEDQQLPGSSRSGTDRQPPRPRAREDQQLPGSSRSGTCNVPQFMSSRRGLSLPTRRPPWMSEYGQKTGTGKKKSKKVKLSMWEHEFICLANVDQSIPPTPMEKADLINAGLGPKKICLFEYGGYELLRTLPNNNRQLGVIPPQSGGYTVQYLKNVVGSAKVFIRPLQQKLCLKRVLENKDLGIAPTEICLKCDQSIPLCQLKQHLDTCKRLDSPLPQAFSEEEEFSYLSSPPESPLPPAFSPITPNNSGVQVQDHTQSSHLVDLTLENDILLAVKNSMDDFCQPRELNCLSHIVLALRAKCGIHIPDVNSEDWEVASRTSIDVRRGFVVEDGIREAKKKRFNTSNLLRVSFVSEAAVDTGGPLREFYRLFAKGVTEKYCTSNESGQCFPLKNVVALQNEDFKNIGKITAMSIVQGGSGIPAFHPSVYRYICTGTYLGVRDDTAVPNEQVRTLLREINDADTDEKLRLIFEDDEKVGLVCDTGYSKALCLASMADKDGIKNALRDYHSLIKIKAELDQFTEGLHTCEVLKYVQNYSDLMQPLFCQQPSVLSKDFFKKFPCVFSLTDSNRKAKEEAAYIFFMDFLEECEDGTSTTENGDKVTLDDVLIFFTGADREPPLGFQPVPTLTFTDAELATASTCSLRLRLPCRHSSYDVFRSKLMLSLRGNDGMGLA
ncbi:uncharacterized protein LOC135337323 isoform X2 [Halichondria panicea]|uniref:uncharacterized protein LOC135337323 isoform X2 n=1 Tax=Halichondria panicea TaxID=6063 RepID=UPI00312B3EAE